MNATIIEPPELVHMRLPQMLHPEAPQGSRKLLQQEAHIYLGYSLVDEGEGPSQAYGTSKLLAVLRDLEVIPYTSQSVKAFMDWKVRTANEELERNKRAASAVESAKGFPWRLLGYACIAYSAVSLIMLPFSQEKQEDEFVLMILASLFAACFCFWIGRGQIMDNLASAFVPRHRYAWQVCSFEDYIGDIPDSVIQTAIEIKKHIPSAKFNIHSLGLDPLVELLAFNHSFYIDHWDEPLFKPVQMG